MSVFVGVGFDKFSLSVNLRIEAVRVRVVKFYNTTVFM